MTYNHINAGNLIVFYDNLAEKMNAQPACASRGWGLLSPHDEIPKWQLTSTQSIDNALQKSWRLVPTYDSGLTPIGLLGNLITYQHVPAENRYYATYNGGAVTDICGIYYIEVTIVGKKYYSEDINFQKLNFSKTQYFRLTVSNSFDFENVMYSQGYTQSIVLELYQEFPQENETLEVTLNAEGIEKVDFQAVKNRIVYQIPNFPEYWAAIFKRLKSHSSVKLTNLRTNKELVLEEIDFNVADQDDCFKQGLLSFTAGNFVGKNYGTNKVVA